MSDSDNSGFIKTRVKRIIGKGWESSTPGPNSTTDTGTAAIERTRKGIIKTTKIYGEAKNSVKSTYKAAKGTFKVGAFVGDKIIGLFKKKALSGILPCVFVIMFVVVMTMIITSLVTPFLTVFAGDDTVKAYQTEMTLIESEFIKSLDNYKKPGYDNYRIEYIGENGGLKVSWKEILCFMAVEFNQGLSCSDDEKKALKDIFYKLVDIQTRDVVEEVAVSDKNGKITYKNSKVLIIEVYMHSLEDIINDLGWDEEQKELYYILLDSGFEEMFPGVDFNDITYSHEEVKSILENLEETSITRDRLIKTALSLVGKVGYFWGGRSPAGWNSEWGKLKLVTAPGSPKSGTYQPYGLDCSGFVGWCYDTSGFGSVLSGGTAIQWTKSYAISESELLPGDLVFKQTPSSAGVNHVGIFYKRANGQKVYIHCASGQGVVMNSYSGFKYFRRAFVKFMGE